MSTPATTSRRTTRAPADLLRRLLEGVAPFRGRARTPIVSVPVPAVAPERLLALADGRPSLFWSPPRGASVVGLGVAHRCEASGEERFDAVRASARDLWRRIVPLNGDDCDPGPARLYGGLAFSPGGASAPWESFGDASFVLPRWTYRCLDDRATLSLACPGETLAHDSEPEALGAELERILTALDAVESDRPDDPGSVCSLEQLPCSVWSARVEAIRAAIAAGDFEKIVAARCALVELDRPIEPAQVMRRFSAGAPLTRFVFGRSGAAFLGATPERLVALRGDRVSTEALAGTVARGRAQELLESRKDWAEQAVVVRQIVQALEPFTTDLRWPNEPVIRTLPHMLHLRTPIEGRTRADVHVLDLVRALHPTPAVGGVPSAAAREWIVRHEEHPRGWYAGPIGWFDASGEGEFGVALRSGLVVDRRAWVYAGAGIVGDSDPEGEYAETALKQRALMTALGIVG